MKAEADARGGDCPRGGRWEDLSREQLLLLLEAFGPGAKLTLLFGKGSGGAVEILSKLIGTFYVRLVRSEADGRPIAGG